MRSTFLYTGPWAYSWPTKIFIEALKASWVHVLTPYAVEMKLDVDSIKHPRFAIKMCSKPSGNSKKPSHGFVVFSNISVDGR